MQVEINGKLKFVSTHETRNGKEFIRILIERPGHNDEPYRYVVTSFREDVNMEELVEALNTKVTVTAWLASSLFNQVDDRITLETYSNNLNLVNINLKVLGKFLGKHQE